LLTPAAISHASHAATAGLALSLRL
jgi:hypothetical protein